MKKLFFMLFVALATISFSLNFVSCSDDDLDPADRPGLNILENLSDYQGIWHSVALDILGHRVPIENDPEVQDLYVIADPENNRMGLYFPGDENTEPELFAVKQSITNDSIVLIDPDKYDDYKKNPESVFTLGVSYKALSEKEVMATIQLKPFASEEDIILKKLVVYFDKDDEFENKLIAQTRGDGNWFTNTLHRFSFWITGEKRPGTGISEPWKNSGWSPSNWMSKLSDDLPVARVNIPGSHDSSASEESMGSISKADLVDAWVQDYSIAEQFQRGARYFDLRVGCPFVKGDKLGSFRSLTREEMDAKKDLMMYHGPLPTETMFYETLKQLKDLVKGSTEFVFINVQAEKECNGIIAEKSMDWGLVTSTGNVHDIVNYQSMYIAGKLLKEMDQKEDLFIFYNPSLTVEEARGHIIVLMDRIDRHHHIGLPDHITYYEKWPTNSTDYADIVYFDDSNTEIRFEKAMYVQSRFEMTLEADDKILQKKIDMEHLAKMVTSNYENPQNVPLLGFNATNANTGDPLALRTMVHAATFNTCLYYLYRENMDETLTPSSSGRFHCGIVPMDHYGFNRYVSLNWEAFVCGEYLAWAVIESNFYEKHFVVPVNPR